MDLIPSLMNPVYIPLPSRSVSLSTAVYLRIPKKIEKLDYVIRLLASQWTLLHVVMPKTVFMYDVTNRFVAICVSMSIAVTESDSKENTFIFVLKYSFLFGT
jgi:hypothetical protein